MAQDHSQAGEGKKSLALGKSKGAEEKESQVAEQVGVKVKLVVG